MSEVPELTVDGREMELLDDDPLSNSSIKAKIAWDNRDSEYVLVWWQSPFYIVTENGGYSMTASLVDQIPDNIEIIWVVDTNESVVRSFERAWYESDSDRVTVSPDDPRFKNVAPSRQYAVDKNRAIEQYPIDDVTLP